MIFTSGSLIRLLPGSKTGHNKRRFRAQLFASLNLFEDQQGIHFHTRAFTDSNGISKL